MINFIDETVFLNNKAFYARYHRKPENYPELSEKVSRFCFRTTQEQVDTYVKFTKRIPVTAEFTLTELEQQLYDMLYDYLQKPEKIAYPKMDQYRLTMMFLRTFSSSTFAVTQTLRGTLNELKSIQKANPNNKDVLEELEQFHQMYKLANSITENAKGKELLSILKKGFSELKKLGANKKALIFTESRETQKYLYSLLNQGAYKGKVLTYSGDKSRDYTVMTHFESEAQILISTDVAAEGFDLKFCAFVINYDIPYNTLTLEQRILRCHRQNQQSVVIVVNFLNKNNYAEVRVLELINKRILQFDGIIGMTEQVMGNFGVDFGNILASARTKNEIDKAWEDVLNEFEEENRQIVEKAEQTLFTSFSKEIAESSTITLQYIKEKIKTINIDLWEVVKHFFQEYNEKNEGCQFVIDDEFKTVSPQNYGDKLPHLFYYFAGKQNRPYTSLKSYGMDINFKPRSGRITLSSIIGKGILSNFECANKGEIIVQANIENCTIGLYSITLDAGNMSYEYNLFVGKTESGRILQDNQCKK